MRAARSFVIVGVITVGVIVLTTSRGQSAAPPQPGWRARFTTAMGRIQFDSKRGAIFYPGTPKGVYPPGAQSLRIETPVRRDSGRAGRIIARISSDTGYPRLGLAAGVNYLWQDVDSGKTRLLVIPANSEAPMKWLDVRGHDHRWPTQSARLVIMSDSIKRQPGTPSPAPPAPTMEARAYICTSQNCTSAQWCTVKDTILHATLSQPTTSVAQGVSQYFARNRVAWTMP